MGNILGVLADRVRIVWRAIFWPRGIKSRPLIVTIVCIMGFLSFSFVMLRLFDSSVIRNALREYDLIFLYFAMTANLFGMSGLVGYWFMRKWGVYFYASMFLISLACSFFYSLSQIFWSHLMPLLILLVGVRYFKKMS